MVLGEGSLRKELDDCDCLSPRESESLRGPLEMSGYSNQES
jgi:hypothetical protein